MCKTGLPDDIFSYQTSQVWSILQGLGMEIIGTFYGHLEYFTAIWNILQLPMWNMFQLFGICYSYLEFVTAIWNMLQLFGIFYSYLEYFTAIWYIFPPI
jgi:hypothetical protein